MTVDRGIIMDEILDDYGDDPTGLNADSDDFSKITGANQDLTLPRQTIANLVQDLMPDGFVCPRDTRDLLVSCAGEFVHLITSEANEVCERLAKKTIMPEHFMEALRNLGFGEYCLQVEQALQEHQEAAKQKQERNRRLSGLKLVSADAGSNEPADNADQQDNANSGEDNSEEGDKQQEDSSNKKPKRKKKRQEKKTIQQSGPSQEELARQQADLFEQAKLKMQQRMREME